MKPYRRWTIEEDEILVQTVTANPHNLKRCFLSVALKTGRTEKGVSHRWYQRVKFTSEGRKALLTIGRGSTYPGGKNDMDTNKEHPIKYKKTTILWKRILTLLRIK